MEQELKGQNAMLQNDLSTLQNKFNFSLESHDNDQEFLDQINKINYSGRDSSNHIRVQLTQPIKRPKSSAISMMAKPKSNNQRSSMSGVGATTNMQDSSFDTNRQLDSILMTRHNLLPPQYSNSKL